MSAGFDSNSVNLVVCLFAAWGFRSVSLKLNKACLATSVSVHSGPLTWPDRQTEGCPAGHSASGNTLSLH